MCFYSLYCRPDPDIQADRSSGTGECVLGYDVVLQCLPTHVKQLKLTIVLFMFLACIISIWQNYVTKVWDCIDIASS